MHSSMAKARYTSHNLKGFLDSQANTYASYRLKQAQRIWYLFLYEMIVGLGFAPLETGADPNANL
jgi:hypothetical protein